MPFEVALESYSVVLIEGFPILTTENLDDLFRPPHEELALDALAVGVLGGVESALRVGHLP